MQTGFHRRQQHGSAYSERLQRGSTETPVGGENEREEAPPSKLFTKRGNSVTSSGRVKQTGTAKQQGPLKKYSNDNLKPFHLNVNPTFPSFRKRKVRFPSPALREASTAQTKHDQAYLKYKRGTRSEEGLRSLSRSSPCPPDGDRLRSAWTSWAVGPQTSPPPPGPWGTPPSRSRSSSRPPPPAPSHCRNPAPLRRSLGSPAGGV